MKPQTTLSIPDKAIICPIFLHKEKRSPLQYIKNIKQSYSSIFIITDENVYAAQPKIFAKFSSEQLFVFPTGEAQKTLKTVHQITEKMAQTGIDRQSLLLGIGGGVTTDIAAFAASIYQRGIDTALIPTSLLAMVDASIGGKTGVDTSWGKNQLGTFYWPKSIHICPELLKTLPHTELRNGIAEMIKHGIVISEKHFSVLEQIINTDFDWTDIAPFVFDSIDIKSAITHQDPYEQSGERAKLNLGHTFAHAIETDSQYSIPHGQAVAIGLRMATELAKKKELVDEVSASRIINVVQKLFPEKNMYPLSNIIQYMGTDKKKDGPEIRFILPQKIGKVMFYPILVEDLANEFR